MPKFSVGDRVMVNYPNSDYDLRVGTISEIVPKSKFNRSSRLYKIKGSDFDCDKPFRPKHLISLGRKGKTYDYIAIRPISRFGSRRALPEGVMNDIAGVGTYYRVDYDGPYRRADDMEGVYREADFVTKIRLESDLKPKVDNFISREFPNVGYCSTAYRLLSDSIMGE